MTRIAAAKDLTDLQDLLRSYEQGSERLFGHEVFEARLPDIEFAGAFLLGLDTRLIATKDDVQLVQTFVKHVLPKMGESSSEAATRDDDWRMREMARFQEQMTAFLRGLRWKGHP